MITSKEITGVDRDRELKWCYIDLTYEAIAKMLSLPKGCTIVSTQDTRNNRLELKCIHTGLKSTKEGGEIPVLMPGQGNWIGDI